MIKGEDANSISRLTELLAAHGVYALTIIFIFYQQWRAGRNLQTAGAADHAYFRKVYTSVVTATYALVVISTAVWIYATFIYFPKFYIRGSVSGLTEQVASPQKQGDPPKVIETIAPESLEIDLYQTKKNKDETSSEGKYDLGWVLLPLENVHTLVFRLQHRYEKIKSTKRASLNPIPSAGSLESKKTEKRFTLDLRKINYSPGSSIQLMYEPDSQDQVEKIGKMYFRETDSGNRVEIPWEEVTPGKKTTENQKSGFSFPSTVVVYASSREKSIFKENGDYDPQLGRVLRERLGNSDLKTQLAARDLLADSGKRSFKFILDSLNAPSDASDSKALLVSNLASVVRDIESAGAAAPRNIHLTLAKAFFDLNDSQSSAEFFDKAGEKPNDHPELYFERAVVYYQTKSYDRAITNLNEFLEKDHRSYSQALAHTILGSSYKKLGRDQEAVSHFGKAIYIYPTLAMPYNGLAYLYADRGEKLEEALRLVNRALALEKDPDELANDKDTKGWILYKLGKYDEALSLIKEAATKISDDPVIREHLRVVQNESLHLPKK
jgi:tetratricopeptide (TPR) repeat protein